MLTGLRQMTADELLHLARLLGTETEAVRGRPVDVALEALLQSLGDAVGCPSSEPAAIERAVLTFLAEAWGLSGAAEDSVVEMEERIFFHLCEHGAQHLSPVWRVAACMAGLSYPAARSHEVHFLESVASRLIASDAVRRAMQEGWQVLCERPASAEGALNLLGEDIAALRRNRHLIRPALDLALVVALVDASLEPEETSFYRQLGEHLHLQPRELELAQETVVRTFWSHMTRVNDDDENSVERVRQAALLAACLTLEQLGTLQALEDEVLREEFSGLHAVLTDPDFHHGVEGWQKRGFLWPVGFVLGFGHYLKGRLQHRAHRHVAAVAYLAYAREKEPAVTTR